VETTVAVELQDDVRSSCDLLVSPRSLLVSPRSLVFAWLVVWSMLSPME
jgi:hypothetical protein